MTLFQIILILSYLFICLGFSINAIQLYLLTSENSTFIKINTSFWILIFSPFAILIKLGGYIFNL